MRKTFMFLLIGIFAVTLWLGVLYLYVNKVTERDVYTFLEENSLKNNVSFGKLHRNFFGLYKARNIKIINTPNNGFTFSVGKMEIDDTEAGLDKKTLSVRLSAIDFDIYDYLQTKMLDGEVWWKKGRNFAFADTFIPDTAYTLAIMGIKKIHADLDISVAYNISTGVSYLRVHAEIMNIVDIIFSAMIETDPVSLFKYMLNFVKSPDENILPGNLSFESVQLIIDDKGLAEKIYGNLVLYSYEDDDNESVSFAKTNILSENFIRAGYSRERADENARNLADFYNRKNKVSIISSLNGKINWEKLRGIKNIFNLLAAFNADVFILSDPVVSRVIQIDE